MNAIAAAAAVIAAALGGVLASSHLRPQRRRPHGALRLAHGGLGAAAVAGLLAALGGVGWAASPFVWDALALLAAAALSGAGYWLLGGRLGGQRGLVLALHGFAGFVGAVLLAGWALG